MLLQRFGGHGCAPGGCGLGRHSAARPPRVALNKLVYRHLRLGRLPTNCNLWVTC